MQKTSPRAHGFQTSSIMREKYYHNEYMRGKETIYYKLLSKTKDIIGSYLKELPWGGNRVKNGRFGKINVFLHWLLTKREDWGPVFRNFSLIGEENP